MNTVAKKPGVARPAETAVRTAAVAALEQDPAWLTASEQERVVLKRIAMQRDRLMAAQKAQLQTKALRVPAEVVPADAPLAERLAVFVKLHPVATAVAAGIALMIGPRKLIRYGGLALPLISRFKR